MFICSTTSKFNNFKPQQLQPQKRVQNEKNKQNRRPEPRKHTKNPHIAPLFFGTMRLFETFWIAPKGPPSFVSIFCNTTDVKKSQRVPFYIFRHCDTVQKSHFKKFFGKFFHVPKGSPLQFFFIFSWSFTKLEGPPLSILSLRYGADFGRSQLVNIKLLQKGLTFC